MDVVKEKVTAVKDHKGMVKGVLEEKSIIFLDMPLLMKVINYRVIRTVEDFISKVMR